MKRPFLFILASYNDIDHQTPIIWKIAKSGHPVRILFVDRNLNLDIHSDPHIQFLKKNADCPAHYFYALPELWLKLPNRLLVPSANPVLMKLQRALFKILGRYLWTNNWTEKLLRKINPVMCIADCIPVDDNALEGKLVKAAKKLNIPILGASHGPGVYTNAERLPGFTRPFRQSSMTHPTYINYTHIIATTPHEQALWAEEGFSDMSKIIVRGSARFCDEWMQIHQTIYRPYQPKREAGGRLKIVFFMPHLGTHVDEALVMEAIEHIASLDFVYLIVKEHTREGAGNLSPTLKEKLMNKPNVEIISSTKARSIGEWLSEGFGSKKRIELVDSVPLIQWADAGIAFGTGIGIEVICQKKPLINPLYLYTFASIYEVYGAGIAVQALSELAQCLRDLRKNTSIPYSTDRFRKAILFGEKEPYDVLGSYRELLECMAERRQIPISVLEGAQTIESGRG